jgi:hypothetical protein
MDCRVKPGNDEGEIRARHWRPSPAGLTRGPIILRKKRFHAKTMDCRVKPGNDG